MKRLFVQLNNVGYKTVAYADDVAIAIARNVNLFFGAVKRPNPANADESLADIWTWIYGKLGHDRILRLQQNVLLYVNFHFQQPSFDLKFETLIPNRPDGIDLPMSKLACLRGWVL